MTSPLLSARKTAGAGSIYVFRLWAGGGTWVEEARVVADNWMHNSNDNFGHSVALARRGDLLVVGAPSAGDAFNEGAAYAFRRGESGGWAQEVRLVPDAGAGTKTVFSWCVADDDDARTVAVGAPRERGDRGAVYLFARFDDGGSWEPEHKRRGCRCAGSRSLRWRRRSPRNPCGTSGARRRMTGS